MTCPAGYECIPSYQWDLLIKAIVALGFIVAVALIATLSDPEPPKPEDTNRPKAKKPKGK